MKEIQALIFDVDGTLADTERDGHRVAFNRAFEQAGLDWDWTVALYGDLLAVTGGKERILYYLEKFNTDFQRPADLAGFIADLHAAKTRIYTELLAGGGIPLRNGVERLLNEARMSGMRLAIATTTTEANVEALLIHTLGPGSMSWFEVIGAGDIVPAKKPSPDIYHHALDALDLKPAQCLALEDSSNGIRSSMGAGIPTLITVNDYTRDHDFNNALLVLDQLGEPDASYEVLGGSAADIARANGPCVTLELLKQITAHAS